MQRSDVAVAGDEPDMSPSTTTLIVVAVVLGCVSIAAALAAVLADSFTTNAIAASFVQGSAGAVAAVTGTAGLVVVFAVIGQFSARNRGAP